jgi:hypothetical protein
VLEDKEYSRGQFVYGMGKESHYRQYWRHHQMTNMTIIVDHRPRGTWIGDHRLLFFACFSRKIIMNFLIQAIVDVNHIEYGKQKRVSAMIW